MSAVSELRHRAALALGYLDAGHLERARAILAADAERMPPPADLSAPHVVADLQAKFAKLRRSAGNIPAALCIITPAEQPGAYQFRFSGHDGVVRLLEGKAGIRPAAGAATGPAEDSPAPALPDAPPDELAAKRAEQAAP